MRVLLIDGSNLVRTFTNNIIKPFSKEKEDSSKLIYLINRANATYGFKKEIFFDGYKRNIQNDSILTDVLFSKDRKADELIVNAAAGYNLYCNMEEVFVVSSDRELCRRCLDYKAQIIRSEEFLSRWLDITINRLFMPTTCCCQKQFVQYL